MRMQCPGTGWCGDRVSQGQHSIAAGHGGGHEARCQPVVALGTVPGLGDCPWQGREAGAAGFLPLVLQRQQLRQRRRGARRAGTGTGSPGGGAIWGGQHPSDPPLHLQENRSPSGSHRDAFTDTPWPDDPPGTPPGSPAPPGRGGRRGAGRPLGVLMTPTFPQAAARLTPSAPRSKSSWSSPPITR